MINLHFGSLQNKDDQQKVIEKAEALLNEMGNDEKRKRSTASIMRSLGGDFLYHFFDPLTTELMLNPDGTLWHEKLSSPMTQFGKLGAYEALNVLNSVADSCGKVIGHDTPTLSANFPLDGSRFQGFIPPVVHSASFVMRKKARSIFTLETYVEKGGLTQEQFDEIVKAVKERKNILVVGGTGTGKTTLMNAIIQKISELHPHNRILTIEDTEELQVKSANLLSLFTSSAVSMDDLIRDSLRSRPDHILVGEVRGKEALSVLDAWSTGHPGGSATVHSNSALEGLDHLAGLVTRHKDAPPFDEILKLVGTAVDVVVHIARLNGVRKVNSVLYVDSYDRSAHVFRYREHFSDGSVRSNLTTNTSD